MTSESIKTNKIKLLTFFSNEILHCIIEYINTQLMHISLIIISPLKYMTQMKIYYVEITFKKILLVCL